MDFIDFSKIYSYSKLGLFEKCPKSYHFTYLDEVYSKMKSELKRDPSNIWPFYIIGRSVHDAITLFFYLPEDEKTAENLKEQLKLTWKSEAMPQKIPPLGKWGGFKDLEEERQYYRQALEMLANFFKTLGLSLSRKHKKLKIKYLPTKDLARSIEDYKNLIRPISGNFDISGKFDLIISADDDLSVVDFKTSKSEDYNNFQLQFYKLLAELNFKLPVNKASFYYLSTGNIKEFDLAKSDSEKIKKEVLKKIDKIQACKDFKPKPSKLCQYCIFRTFCPAKKEVSQYIDLPKDQDFSEDLPF